MLENEEDTADSVPVSSSGETDLAGGGADKAAEGASAPGTGIPETGAGVAADTVDCDAIICGMPVGVTKGDIPTFGAVLGLIYIPRATAEG